MTRKEKRKLQKDKSLVCGLFHIIEKYLPRLFHMFDDLTDIRQQGKITYSMKVICVTRLFGLLCGITTMNSLTHKFNNEITISNFSKLLGCNLEDLPHYDTINDVFDDLNIDELRKIQKYIVNTLIRSKMFDKFRYDGKFQLLDYGSSFVYGFEGKLKEISFAILSELISTHIKPFTFNNFQLRFDKLII